MSMNRFESDYHALLNELCGSPELESALHPYSFIRGCIFAVSAAPEIPMPEVWLPWVIKNNNQLTSIEQADNLTDVLMKILQLELKDMSDEIIQLPRSVAFPDDYVGDNELSLWCQGMLLGHSQLESVWQDAWDKMQVTEQSEMRALQKDLTHCLNMLTTFADIPLAIEQAQSRGNPNLSATLPKIFLSMPSTLKTYIGLSGRLVDFLPNQFETFAQKAPGQH